MDKRSIGSAPPLGASSILTVFALLCLTVFALLSLSTVQANLRLGDRAQAALEAYYAADSEAEAVLAALRRGEMPPGVRESGGVYYYSCPISETQTLELELKLRGSDYEILRWQAVSTGAWSADESLPVWNGKDPG